MRRLLVALLFIFVVLLGGRAECWPLFDLNLGLEEDGSVVSVDASAADQDARRIVVGGSFGGEEEGGPSLSWTWGGARGYVGGGAIGPGLAFRRRAYAKASGTGSALWSTSGSGQVLGWSQGGLGMVWEAEASGGNASQDGEKTFKAVVLQCTPPLPDPFVCSASLGAALWPAEEASEGWRPGSVGEPGQTVFDLGLYSGLRWARGGLGLWASTTCGGLVSPGLACSVQFESRFPLRLRPSSAPIDLKFAVFAYAAGEEYREFEGGRPSRDMVLEGELGVAGAGWSAGLLLNAASLGLGSGDSFDYRLCRPGTDALERLLWLWRTDLLRLSFAGSLAPLTLSLAAKADGDGLNSLRAALGAKFPLLVRHRLGLEAAFELGLGRSGYEDEDDAEEDEEEETEAGEGSLSVRRLRARLGLLWGDSEAVSGLSSASARFALTADPSASWALSLGFVLELSLRLGEGFLLRLGATSPEGGYSLAETPSVFPDLEIGLRLGRGSI